MLSEELFTQPAEPSAAVTFSHCPEASPVSETGLSLRMVINAAASGEAELRSRISSRAAAVPAVPSTFVSIPSASSAEPVSGIAEVPASSAVSSRKEGRTATFFSLTYFPYFWNEPQSSI